MRKNARSTAASTTPATDGKLVFVTLPNSDAIWLTAVRQDGAIAWQVRVSDYVEHQGYGASPALYQDLVIVSSDNKAGGVIAAYLRASGELVWKRDRPKLPNYPSPILLRASGRDQVVVTGCDRITSLDPKTGDTLWETEGATTECVTSTVTDGKRIFTSGGYPRNHMSAVLADGSKTKVWENDNRLYVPSPLYRDGTLYGVLDAGIAMAWDSETGKELWKQRLGGTFSASPVLVGDLIYATNEAGETFLFRADPKRFESLGKVQLGREVFATPVISGGAIYYRCTEAGEGERREMLYCIRP
jgi:outer membrane protein assembly factor BamB